MIRPEYTVEEIVAYKAYEPLQFDNPLVMIATYHGAMQEGHIGPYQWQAEVNEQLAIEGFTKNLPMKYYLVAANGSGKDAYVISPFAVWFASTKIRARVVITSASHSQLEGQTEKYIRMWCNMINAAHKDDPRGQPFVVKKQHIECRYTGGEIVLFATDDEGRAEGYHPFPDAPDGQLAVIINEGKTVRDEIYMALNRCTYSHWVVVSSPGKDSGNLYQSFKKATQWPEPLVPGQLQKYARRVTAYECPHIGRDRIDTEAEEMGRHNPWFRSARLAEFTSVDENVVLSMEAIRKSQELFEQRVSYGPRGGLDLALGGDECTFYVFDGNVFKGSFRFKMSDAAAAVALCIAKFKEFGFTKDTASNIFADHGGIGAGLRALFDDRGWALSWVMNQSKAIRRNSFCANRGAELWMNFRGIVEHNLVLLPSEEEDPKLYDQLSSRYYQQHKASGKLVLEAKADARAKGHGSPDRADAVILAFTGLTYEAIQELAAGKTDDGMPRQRRRKAGQPVDTNTLAQRINDERYARLFPRNNDSKPNKGRKRPIYSVVTASFRPQTDLSLGDQIKELCQSTTQTIARQKPTSTLYTRIGRAT